MVRFISRDYLASALLKAKREIFGENFVTISELNEFDTFIQNKFNENAIDACITSNSLSREDFYLINDVIVPTENCCYDVYLLSLDVLTILINEDILIEFFNKIYVEEKAIVLSKYKKSK